MRITDGRDIAVISPGPPPLSSIVTYQDSARPALGIDSNRFLFLVKPPCHPAGWRSPVLMKCLFSTRAIDARSIAAKRFLVAQNQAKPQMAKAMIKRAQRGGVDAQYFLADAWFCTKPIIKTAEDALLVAIVRMKKNKMKYRFSQLAGARSFATTWMSTPSSSRPSAANE